MHNKLWGLDRAEYDQLASRYSKANIFLWIIAGIIYNLFHSNLISISTFLLLLPGIFVISFASIPTFYMDLKKRQIVPQTNNIFILILFSIWYLIDLVYPIVLAIGYILLIEYLLKRF